MHVCFLMAQGHVLGLQREDSEQRQHSVCRAGSVLRFFAEAVPVDGSTFSSRLRRIERVFSPCIWGEEAPWFFSSDDAVTCPCEVHFGRPALNSAEFLCAAAARRRRANSCREGFREPPMLKSMAINDGVATRRDGMGSAAKEVLTENYWFKNY